MSGHSEMRIGGSSSRDVDGQLLSHHKNCCDLPPNPVTPTKP